MYQDEDIQLDFARPRDDADNYDLYFDRSTEVERVRFDEPEVQQIVSEEPPKDSFAFTHDNQFGLPNYYGDLPGNNKSLPVTVVQAPIEINRNKKGPVKKSVAKAKRQARPWDGDTRMGSKFFDKNIEKEHSDKKRPVTAKFTRTTGDQGDTVKFYSKGGRQTSTLHMVREIEQLSRPTNVQSTYSMSQNRVEREKLAALQKAAEAGTREQRKRSRSKSAIYDEPRIEVANVSFEPEEVKRLDRMVETGQTKVMIEQTIADAKMNSLMSQALDQKNGIIKTLEKELALERKQRRDLGKDFSTSIKDYNEERKQLQVLKAKADKLERKEQERQKEIDAELDQVPTNMKKGKKL